MPDAGLLSNQGEQRKKKYFIRVPLKKKYSSMVLQSPGVQCDGLTNQKNSKILFVIKLLNNSANRILYASN